MGDDLADDRRDRLAVPEHPALDLDAVLELLHEHLLVVAEGKLDRGLELVLPPHLRDPDRGAEPGRLDEDRVGERMLDRVARPQRHAPADGDRAVAEHRLEEILVHAESGRRDAGADVGNGRELEQALHRAVLSERAVQDREHDVDRPERCRGVRLRHRQGVGRAVRERERLCRGELPAPVAPDPDRRHLVALRVEGGHDGARRERDLVLARATAREHRDPDAVAHGVGIVSSGEVRSSRREGLGRRRCWVVMFGRRHVHPDGERHERVRVGSVVPRADPGR